MRDKQQFLDLVQSHAQQFRASFIGSAKDQSAYRSGADKMKNEIGKEYEELLLQRDELLEALKKLRRDYLHLLEIGRDRLSDCGWVCDPLDVMERGSIQLKDADAAIKKAESK